VNGYDGRVECSHAYFWLPPEVLDEATRNWASAAVLLIFAWIVVALWDRRIL
jgi:hypothetical protein